MSKALAVVLAVAVLIVWAQQFGAFPVETMGVPLDLTEHPLGFTFWAVVAGFALRTLGTSRTSSVPHGGESCSGRSTPFDSSSS
jgi:hypothetical protein